MLYHKSNTQAVLRRDKDLKIPATQAEFDSLGYSQRAQLASEHPRVYKRFTDKRPEWRKRLEEVL